MSTKIYFAFRMKTKALPNFLKRIREHAIKKAAKVIKDVLPLQDVAEQLKNVYTDKEWSEKMTFDEFSAKRETAYRLGSVFYRAIKASRSKCRDPYYCFDCSLNVWWHKGWFYVIPYGESWLYRNFRLPEGVENYPYWNNTDQPSNVSLKAWRLRGKTWDQVCLDDWNSNRLVHEIINAKENLGMVELGKKCAPKLNPYDFIFIAEKMLRDETTAKEIAPVALQA